jgi:hypothetical protein
LSPTYSPMFLNFLCHPYSIMSKEIFYSVSDKQHPCLRFFIVWNSSFNLLPTSTLVMFISKRFIIALINTGFISTFYISLHNISIQMLSYAFPRSINAVSVFLPHIRFSVNSSNVKILSIVDLPALKQNSSLACLISVSFYIRILNTLEYHCIIYMHIRSLTFSIKPSFWKCPLIHNFLLIEAHICCFECEYLLVTSCFR